MTAVTGWTAPGIPPHLLAQRDMTARKTGGRCPMCRYMIMRGERISLPFGSRALWVHQSCLLEARNTGTENT